MSDNKKFLVKVIPEEDFPLQLDGQIKEQLTVAFPHSANYLKDNRGWKGTFPLWNVVVFDVDDKPLGYIGVIERTITIEQENFKIFGLQNVYVIEEYRGYGLAQKMLVKIEKEALKRSLDFGLLFCRPHVEPLYLRAGWKPLGRPQIFVTNDQEEVVERPFVHDSLFFKPITLKEFPKGDVFFNGPDW